MRPSTICESLAKPRIRTQVTFQPDHEIFTETTEYEYDIFQSRIRELAFLNKGIEMNLIDERDGCFEFIMV